MALRGLGGIDPFFFGLGLNGDVDFGSDTDMSSLGDASYKTVRFTKANVLDPDFTVNWPGGRIFATRKIYIGNGATLSANGSVGGTGSVTDPNPGGAAALGATMGAGGSAGGAGGKGTIGDPNDGTGSASNDSCIGGRGGNGGAVAGATGGVAGAVSDDDLLGTATNWIHLLMGAGVIQGTMEVFRGGSGGGGGGAGSAGIGANFGGGGGGGGGIILLAAPVIEIDSGGILFARGGRGGNASGGVDAGAGGGGGGGGGAIILIYGTLIMNGTMTAVGGDGGNGNTSGLGGVGGFGGHIYHFGGTDDLILRQTSSQGANGTP